MRCEKPCTGTLAWPVVHCSSCARRSGDHARTISHSRPLKVGLLARGALTAMKTAVTTARPRHAIDAVGWATLLRSELSVNLPQARFFNSQDPSRFCDICPQIGLPEAYLRLCSHAIFLGSFPDEQLRPKASLRLRAHDRRAGNRELNRGAILKAPDYPERTRARGRRASRAGGCRPRSKIKEAGRHNRNARFIQEAWFSDSLFV